MCAVGAGAAERGAVGLEVGAVSAKERAVLEAEAVAERVLVDEREVSGSRAERRADRADAVESRGGCRVPAMR